MQTRELVLVVLLWATIGMLALANLAYVATYFSDPEIYRFSRHGLFIAVLAGVCGLYVAFKRGCYRLAANGLLVVYFIVAVAMMITWGADVAVSILVFGLVITMAGILYGARLSLIMTAAVITTLFLLQQLHQQGVIQPDRTWTQHPPVLTDTLGFGLILAIQVAVAWIFNMRMERALKRALRAEDKLTRQKELLEIKVAERTRELQAVQLEKTQQVYNFAELGQRSMGLLHELANNLTTLNFDIEALSGHDRSQQVERVKKGVAHIEASIRQVRAQLQGEDAVTTFIIEDELKKVIESLTYKAQHHSVLLILTPTRQHTACMGDPVRFRQMATNLISNGIDAYGDEGGHSHERTVTVTVTAADGKVAIAIRDYGKGISKSEQDTLFEPFHGSNPNGMGLGLYIANRIAEQAFDGTILLQSNKQPTTFIIYMTEHASAT